MNRVAVVFWSGTGCTEAMADAVAEGARAEGAEADLFFAGKFDPDTVDKYDALAFGCPAMGAESLEMTEFEPVFKKCEDRLSGKPVALFGSHDWGTGEWLESWEERCKDAGIALACESVKCKNAPDAAGIAECRALGAALAKA